MIHGFPRVDLLCLPVAGPGWSAWRWVASSGLPAWYTLAALGIGAAGRFACFPQAFSATSQVNVGRERCNFVDQAADFHKELIELNGGNFRSDTGPHRYYFCRGVRVAALRHLLQCVGTEVRSGHECSRF